MTNNDYIDQLDSSQPHEEPSTIDLIQIPMTPLRQLAGPPLALLPIQRPNSTPTSAIVIELIQNHHTSYHYCY